MLDFTIKEFSVASVSIINLIVGLRYCILIYKKKIKPALAMWSFFTIAVAMSLTTYMANDNFTFWDSILNTTDLVLVSSVTIVIFIFGDKSSKFTGFDKICLLGVVLIALFWFITKTHFLSHILVQGILVISYFPVIRRLWQSKENSESFSVWILIMIVPLFSLLSSKGMLATIYAVRAVICPALLVILMLRIEYINKRDKVNSNESRVVV